MTAKKITYAAGAAAIGGALLLFFGFGGYIQEGLSRFSGEESAAAALSLSSLYYIFHVDGTLPEAGSIDSSTSPYFWINSGGALLLKSGLGMTMQGDAPPRDKFFLLYKKANPTDTDQGLHPQNIFRLVTRSPWNNATEEAYFFIARDNFSASPNHNASNGLLLMSRYAPDGQTLYYAGVRVDGTAVIKKKYAGTYYTMAQKQVFPGTYPTYQENANLIPHQRWIGLRTDTTTDAAGAVHIALLMQLPGGSWTPLLSAADSGQYAHTPPILGPAYDGIRTDFMDVWFDNYRISPL